jgi:G3E family GTPase
MFDIGGFDLIDGLELLADPSEASCPTCGNGDGHDCHEHGAQTHRHDDIESFSFRSNRPLRGDRIAQLLNAIVESYGDRLMRYKGVLHIANTDHKLILQGVHQLASHGYGAKWPADEPRTSKLVFIGRDLPRAMLARSLEQCEV